MTDRAAPGAQGSTVRNMEYGQMGMAPAPFLLPYEEESLASKRWDGLESPNETVSENRFFRGPFAYGADLKGEPYFSLTPGEGFVNGWFATDEMKETPDLSAYQEEEVTIVVGWDPDAVYSSDVHDDRESADRVFVDLLEEVDETKPFIPVLGGIVIEDGDGGLELEGRIDYRSIGRPIETFGVGEVVESSYEMRNTAGPGVNLLRGRPTTFTGAVNTGPHEAPVNAERTVHAFAPVDADAESGTEAQYTDLDVAGTPAGRYHYTHSEGGVYGSQFNAAIGRLGAINANLSFEFETFDGVTGWRTDSSGGDFSASVDERPRRLVIAHDGTEDASTAYGGLQATVLTTQGSIGDFRVTFKDVSYTDSGDNNMFIGVAETDVTEAIDLASNDLSFHYRAASNELIANGESDRNVTGVGTVDWSEKNDISLERRGDEVMAFINGEYSGAEPFDGEGDMKPTVQLIDDDGSATAETVSIGQVIVEALE